MRFLRGALSAAVALAGVCCLTGCAGSQAAAEPEPGDATRSAGAPAVTRGAVTPNLLLTGELRAVDAVALIAPNADLWPLQVRWLAPDGVVVEEGEIVVEFDNSQLLSNLEELRVAALEAANRLLSEQARVASEVDAAAFEVERQRAELAKARIDAEIPSHVLSQRLYEERQLALRRVELELAGAERKLRTTREAGEADVEIQRISLDKARSAVTRAEASIAKLTLRAPRTGVLIAAENRREGRPLRPGDNIYPGTVVAELPDLTTLEVEARLFDVDDERVRPGQPVRAWLDAFPEIELDGTVREVDEIADQADRFSLRRFFRVKVTLDEIDVERMRPGMSVKVLVEPPPLDDVLRIPRAAIGWSADGPHAVTAGGARAPLELGPCDARYCAVEAGLDEGTELRWAEAGG